MSSTYARSSALKWFEELLERTRSRISRVGKTWTLRGVFEILVSLGDMVFPRLVKAADVLALVLNKIQLTMIESMIMASIWSGIILVVLVILATYIAR